MDQLNLLLRLGAGAALIALLGCVFWALTHLRRIKREAVANEAMPKGGPKFNPVVLICTAAAVFTALLAFCVIEMK